MLGLLNLRVVTGMSYLKNCTNSADLFETTVKVTKEDKKDGTLGIRSIWENIHSGQVFTVCFNMDITKTDKESGIRPVNILTIKWLIFNGVKYIVE